LTLLLALQQAMRVVGMANLTGAPAKESIHRPAGDAIMIGSTRGC